VTSRMVRGAGKDVFQRQIVAPGSRAISTSAAARRLTSPGGTSLALTPSAATSATPPTDAPTTGTPSAIASSATVGPPSRHRDGQHSTSYERSSADTCDGAT